MASEGLLIAPRLENVSFSLYWKEPISIDTKVTYAKQVSYVEQSLHTVTNKTTQQCLMFVAYSEYGTSQSQWLQKWRCPAVNACDSGFVIWTACNY